MSIEDVSFSVSTGVMPLFKRILKSLSDLKMEPVLRSIFHTILYSSSTEQFSITGALPIGDKTRPGPGTSLNAAMNILKSKIQQKLSSYNPPHLHLAVPVARSILTQK